VNKSSIIQDNHTSRLPTSPHTSSPLQRRLSLSVYQNSLDGSIKSMCESAMFNDTYNVSLIGKNLNLLDKTESDQLQIYKGIIYQ
jgi:hypothetical protein